MRVTDLNSVAKNVGNSITGATDPRFSSHGPAKQSAELASSVGGNVSSERGGGDGSLAALEIESGPAVTVRGRLSRLPQVLRRSGTAGGAGGGAAVAPAEEDGGAGDNGEEADPGAAMVVVQDPTGGLLLGLPPSSIWLTAPAPAVLPVVPSRVSRVRPPMPVQRVGALGSEPPISPAGAVVLNRRAVGGSSRSRISPEPDSDTPPLPSGANP
jgi:hypothetical protein